MLATLTYVEGGAMFAERGGSSSFARHAFNELISFIAGWAILIDYIIIVAFAAISVAHYLGPIWGGFTHGWAEIVVAGAVIAFAAAINIGGFTRYVRQRPLIVLALADVVLQVAVIVVGAIVAFHPDRLTAHIDLFTAPSVRHLVEALVVSTLAFAGIEAASDLAPDFSWRRRDLRRVVGRQRDAAAGHLRGDGGDRPDGGAGGVGPGRAADGARGQVHRGAGAGGGEELPAALVVDAAADRGGGDRARWS